MAHLAWKKVWDVLAVLLIFACTGSAAAFASGIVSGFLGLERWSFPWWIAWIVLIFPLYQTLLLGFALVFGKYHQFRARQVKVLRTIRGWFAGPGRTGFPR